MKGLVVEDDLASRTVLMGFLRQYNLGAEFAEDGLLGLEAFKTAFEEKQPFDFICLDIMMPNMNGQETLIKIREYEKEHNVKSSHEVKVFMVSALRTPKDVIQAFHKGGCTDYVTKPVDLKKFRDTLIQYHLL